MIRALIDANVLVSLMTTTGGTLLDIARAWDDDRFEVVVSDHILGEVRRTWRNPYWRTRLSEEEARDLLSAVDQSSETVVVGSVVPGIATHPEDDPVLTAAVWGRVDVLVTGDRQLLKLEAYGDVIIIDPRHFLALLNAA